MSRRGLDKMTWVCKNVCAEKEKPDDWHIPFLSHGRCRTCQAWQRLSFSNRCKCCNSLIALKPRLNHKRKRYE